MSQKKIVLKQKEIKVESSSDEETNSEVEDSSDEESDSETGEKSNKKKIASKQKEIKVESSSSDEESDNESGEKLNEKKIALKQNESKKKVESLHDKEHNLLSGEKLTSKNIENFNNKLSTKGHCNIIKYKKYFIKYFKKCPKNFNKYYDDFNKYYDDFNKYFLDSDLDEESNSDSDSSLNKIKVASLFCGCGGLDYFFHKNENFKVVYANDIDKDSCNTYEKYFNFKPEEADIKNITNIPDCDLLTGGFPCQGFSIANAYRKEGDQRNQLYKELVRLLILKKPLP